LWYHL